MCAVHLDATKFASRRCLGRRNSTDVLADELITAGYIHDDHYLEMKYLDPRWKVAIHIHALALYRAFGGEPFPTSKLDRD